MKNTIKRIIFLLSLLLYLYSQNTFLDISNYEIINKKIPKEFNNYKIIQISDYHNTKNKVLNSKLINKIKEEEPNIIVITGDLIDSTYTDINQALYLVDSIKDVAPIYFINGNHETWTNQYEKLKIELENRKIKILDNEMIVLKQKNKIINLIGINDCDTKKELISNLKSIDYDSNNFNILLSHRPEYFNEYVEENLDLVLTGHAHGGQIRLFNQGLIAPNQKILPKYTSGKINQNNTQMITSRGLGNSVIPIRLNNHPELVIITLKNN